MATAVVDPPPPVRVIVLTGGPCAGKTSAVAHLSKHLSSLGIRVAVVPELATSLISGGVPLFEIEHCGVPVKTLMAKAQMQIEDMYAGLVKFSSARHVVICDRGVLDERAYTPEEEYQEMLTQNGWELADLRERRYDAVIHMVSAAIGAEKYYETNEVRKESVEEAAELDRKCAAAYLGHPRHFFADNTTSFKPKLGKVLNYVLELMDLPLVQEARERRFLVSDSFHEDTVEWPQNEEFAVEMHFLSQATSGQKEELGRLTSRTQGKSATYFCSFGREDASERSWLVRERSIPVEEYMAMKTMVDSARNVVKKKTRTFLYHSRMISVNRYLTPRKFVIVEVKDDSTAVSDLLPSFLPIDKEVSDEAQYTSLGLSSASFDA